MWASVCPQRSAGKWRGDCPRGCGLVHHFLWLLIEDTPCRFSLRPPPCHVWSPQAHPLDLVRSQGEAHRDGAQMYGICSLL